MKRDDAPSKTGRRDFLKLAGGSAVAGTVGLASTAAAASQDDNQPNDDGRYRETEHVKTVYRLARF